MVYLGDNLLKSGISEISGDFMNSPMDGLILLCHVKDPSRFGVAELDETGRILNLTEKPKVPPSDLALVGVYFLSSPVFPIIDSLHPSGRGELEITDAIKKLICSGYHVEARTVSGWWKDTGRVEDILESNRLILNDSIDGKKEKKNIVGGNTWIDRDVTLIPPVVIGDRCNISAGAIIGPYVSIGNDCSIKGASIEDSVLDMGVKIDCKRTLKSSLLGKGVTIVESERSRSKAERGELTLVLGENSYVEL